MGVAAFPEGQETAILVRQEVDKNDVRFVYHHGDVSYARGYVSEMFHEIYPCPFYCRFNSTRLFNQNIDCFHITHKLLKLN